MHSSSLSRTSSVASLSSDDAARRTRKRFTSVQLVMLEQLFHQTSHPTREEREAVAQAAGMEIKSVTIWFQNKRQTERKVALHHASNHPAGSFPSSSSSSSSSVLSSPYASTSATLRTPHTRTLSMSLCIAASTHTHTLRDTPRHKMTPPRTRPSLDRIATRSESRLPPPRTPTKPRDPHAALWDNMPSSPLAPPPASPPTRDLVEFMAAGSSARTLEWACEAARLAGKEERRRTRTRSLRSEGDRNGLLDGDITLPGDDTEEDDIEAVTPEGSLGMFDGARWQGAAGTRTRPGLPRPAFYVPVTAPGVGSISAVNTRTSAAKKDDDDDMMRAALTLCGLGRSRSG